MDRTRWLALPLCALLMAACGSSSGDKLSKSDLIAKADKICSDASKQAKALASQSKGDVQKTVSSAAKVVKDAADKLNGLTPPDSIKADYDTFTSSISASADKTTALSDALKKKDTAKAKSITQSLQQGNVKGKAAAQKIGFKECGGAK